MGAMLLEVHSKDVSEKIIEQELEDTIWIGISDYEQTRYSWRAASTPDTEISYKNFLGKVLLQKKVSKLEQKLYLIKSCSTWFKF